MSDTYILLLANLSKPVDANFDLLKVLNAQLVEKFDTEESPARCGVLFSPQCAMVWARGISVSEFMVTKTFDLGNSITVKFEFPRNQPSNLVEIIPKKKNTSIDLKKFKSVLEDLSSTCHGATCLLLSESRIVVKFADTEEATNQCTNFIEPMSIDGVQTVSSRLILVKEHMVMRAFYVGGSKPFIRYLQDYVEKHGDTMIDFLHSKFEHFKDRPVVLGVNGHVSPTSGVKQDADGQNCEEVNIACATNFDYRLLRNSPPVALPNDAGSLVLRVNMDSKTKKAADKNSEWIPSPPTTISGPPALPPPPNLPHPSSGSSMLATITSSVGSILVASSSNPTPTSAYILWDYGSCPVDEEISTADELDAVTITTMTNNIRLVIDRFAQHKRDIGAPIQITNCLKCVFAPQGNSFKNIEKIPPTWGMFTKNEYKVHHYSKKCSASQLIREVVDGILKQQQRRGAETEKAILCFVTNDPEFPSIAAHLKLDSQNDILLIHQSAHSDITSLAKKHFTWKYVQELSKSKREKEKDKKKDKEKDKEKDKGGKADKGKSAEKDTLPKRSSWELEPGEELEEGEFLVDEMPAGARELVPWCAGGDDGGGGGAYDFGIEEDPELRKGGKKKAAEKSTEILRTRSGSFSIGSNEEVEPSRSGGGMKGSNLKIDAKFSSIATYMKRLLLWRRAEDEEKGISSRNYLLGEDVSGYSEDPAHICTVRVDINPKMKKHVIYIRGPHAPSVNMRFKRIQQMVDDCLKVRQLHNFTGWLPEHRAALIGSEVLSNQEKATRACVLFHYAGNTTVAEIVALRPAMHNALLKFVQKLKPKENMIQIPAAFVCWYDAAIWEKMRSCFLIKAQVVDVDGNPVKAKTGYISPEEADSEVKLKIWGFMPKFMDKAIEHIKRNEERDEISVVPWVDEASISAAAAAMEAAANPRNIKPAAGKDKEKEKEKEKNAKAPSPSTVLPSPAPTASTITASLRGVGSPAVAAAATTAEDAATASLLDNKHLVVEPANNLAVHKSVFTFNDPEAGRFFYSFDDAFRTFLDKAFSVFLDDRDRISQLNLLNSATDPKPDELKVVLCSPILKNVEEARIYMEQFNKNVLGQHQITFPRVGSNKYKEIFKCKSLQGHLMQTLRMNLMSVDRSTPKASQSPVDPLKTPGFVNIRSRPQVHQPAKMNFPTDVNITVCGSLLVEATRTVLAENQAAFNSIPTDYPTASLIIPTTHHMRQALSVVTERDELVKKFGLVALRWEESALATGNVSTCKIWAYTKSNLKVFVEEIMRNDMDGAAATLLDEEHYNNNIAKAVPPHLVSNAHPVPMPVPMPAPMPASMPASMAGAKPAPAPAAMSVSGPAMRGVDSRDSAFTKQPNTSTYNNGSSGLHISPPGGPHYSVQAKIFANAKGAIKREPPPVPHTKAVIYLPDLSLRFILQGEPLKSKLNTVLERLLKNGVHIAYPYKDRTDPHACFELEGEHHIIARASVELNEFIEKAARSLRCVQVIVNSEHFMFLTAGGEGLLSGTNTVVQEMQINCGVHFIFNPPPASTREAFSIFDMRFATELVRRERLEQFGAVEPSLDLSLNGLKKDQEMMSVSVFNSYSQRNVEISIISSNSSESGWTWGVSNLLLLVGTNTLGFNPSEADQLNRGEVLVQTDRNTGKTILRIKPNALTRGVSYQAAVLTNALLKCLQKANELGLKGLAVSAPTDIDAFPELAPELIRSLTVEAVVEFAKKCRTYLRFTKLVCIELGNNVETQAAQMEQAATPSIPLQMVLLERRIEPTQRDRMVRTMTILLERQETEHLDADRRIAYDPRNPRAPPMRPPQVEQSKLSLLTCNVPLPLSMFTSLPSYERPKGFKTFLVKGLLSSVVKAVDDIRTRLAAPKPLDDLPFNVEEFF